MARKLLHKTSAVLAMALAFAAPARAQEQHPPLLLMGTIPIYWGEAGELTDLLNGAATPHWARGHLEQRYTLVPLDTLSADTLPAGGLLLLAQPRTLSAPENVALDAWVRAGGRVLLFADPLMTGESRFSIGDRRRPQDVALLSPLLNHWGLDLELADGQPSGLRMVAGEGGAMPVNLAGTMTVTEGSTCTLRREGLVAICPIGAGLALVVGDAAMLDIEGPWLGSVESLDSLLSTVSGGPGETVHGPATDRQADNDFNNLHESPGSVAAGVGGPDPPS